MSTAIITSTTEAERLHVDGGITDATLDRVRAMIDALPVTPVQCGGFHHERLPIRQEYWDEYTAARVRLQMGTQTPEELAAEAMFKRSQ